MDASRKKKSSSSDASQPTPVNRCRKCLFPSTPTKPQLPPPPPAVPRVMTYRIPTSQSSISYSVRILPSQVAPLATVREDDEQSKWLGHYHNEASRNLSSSQQRHFQLADLFVSVLLVHCIMMKKRRRNYGKNHCSLLVLFDSPF